MTPYLARIDIYPVKALDQVTVPAAAVLPSGALKHDRTFALVDAAGRYVNGKRDARIHRVRSRFSEDFAQITLWLDQSDHAQTFRLEAEKEALEAWFEQYFQHPVRLQQNTEVGFPDDTNSPGPTVISTATLQTVADWFGLSLEDTRQRFRSNLEIDGVPAFWEDQLFAEAGDPVMFQIGSVKFQGINPCQRCIVPTRDPQTGEAIPGFQAEFGRRRAATLPPEVARSRFNHYYRLAVNTRIPPTTEPQAIVIGAPVSLTPLSQC